MASKSVYQKYDTDALTHFGLEDTPVYGVLSSNGVEDVLVTQDKTTYEKIGDLLTDTTETDQTFINRKKAFIMPGSDVSQDRLKAALKEHKITVTNDYELADLIIPNDNIRIKSQHGENIPVTKLLVKLWNYETIDASTSNHPPIENYDKPVILTNKISEKVRYYDLDILESLYDYWVITGMALNIAHKIDIGEVGVVDVETVLHASANKIMLDETLLQDLLLYLDGGNSDNISIAGKIIPTIDYTQNIHLLWELSKVLHNKDYHFRRDKDMQYWMDQARISDLYYSSAEEMILNLEKTNELNKLYFKHFEPIVRKEIDIRNRELYVFKVSVKKEYLKYI